MIDRVARFVGNGVRMRAVHGARLRHQWSDFALLHRWIGVALSEFYLYRTWDRKRPPADRVAYITHADRRLVEAALNPLALQRSLLDKLAITARLVQAGIAVPEVVAAYTATATAPDPNWRSLHGEAGIAELAREEWADGLVIKPNDGGGGQDVHVFRSVGADGFHRIDGRCISPRALVSLLARRKGARWKIERRLRPHPQLNALNPDVLATLRVMSFRRRDGTVMIGPAVWKIPLGRSGVDNFARGSLAAPIELSTGIAGRARRSISEGDFALHPETGFRMEGTRLPQWPMVDPLVRAAFEVLPGLHAVGWDVAITETGPLIIEANPWWSAELLEVPHGRGLIQGEFAEYLCEFGLADLVRRRAIAAASLA